MNSIVILCGGTNCGKTATLRGFFRIDYSPRRRTYIQRVLKGKVVGAVSFGSPQEQEEYCNVKDVNKNIKERIEICGNYTSGKPYILLIPFTMRGSSKRGEKINTECILKPIETLKRKFKVFIIYLRKVSSKNEERDALMKCLAPSITIETTPQDCDKSEELERFLKQLVIRSQ